jgi:prophage DNA circulation protein
MSWQDRLRPVIKFVSPSGLEFTPLWRGNDISAEKRLGRHAYPNVDKEVVQDMGMNSRDIPLTVFFDGVDHDKEAADFEKALYESGVWQVTHPVYGLMRLQLISYKMPVQPLESGNVTEMETEWLEPAEDDDVSAITDPSVAVENAVEQVKTATLADILAMTQDIVSESKLIANKVRWGVNRARSSIISANARINAIQEQINQLTTEAYLDVASIAGSVIELIEAPALMAGSISSKISMFANLGRRIMEDLPNAVARTAAVLNSALTSQLFLNAVTIAMARAVISDLPETRREALSVLNQYRRFTAEAQAALDGAAEMTADGRIESQFVARANSGEAIADLNAAVAKYLMGAMFNLKIERRITLDRQRSPFEIAVTEYKATGESADYYYEFFCRTNGLHGREQLLLNAGREVVIYG